MHYLWGQNRIFHLIEGKISFKSPSGVIEASLDRTAFLASEMGKRSEVSVINIPYYSYNVRRCVLDGHTYSIGLTFHEERLESVSIACSDEAYGTAWSDWTREKEAHRKLFHDRILDRQLRGIHAEFPWGKVESRFDEKTGGSFIVISYR